MSIGSSKSVIKDSSTAIKIDICSPCFTVNLQDVGENVETWITRWSSNFKNASDHIKMFVITICTHLRQSPTSYFLWCLRDKHYWAYSRSNG